MASCTYDNPSTMRREHYNGGAINFSISHEAVGGFHSREIAQTYGIGEAMVARPAWKEGRISGDPTAMEKADG